MAAETTIQDVKTMLQDAIGAMRLASGSAVETTRTIAGQASHPELQALMEKAATVSSTWQERLSRAAETAGESAAAPESNPIVDAIQKVGGKIIHDAQDPVARDLGIIASGQLALHYYIAAFGTMAAYATLLGMPEAAGPIHECLEEAKQGDAHYTALAAKIGQGA